MKTKQIVLFESLSKCSTKRNASLIVLQTLSEPQTYYFLFNNYPPTGSVPQPAVIPLYTSGRLAVTVHVS